MTKRKNPEDKLKVGRKTLYRPELCQELIEKRKKGEIIAGIVSDWKISTQTIYEWGRVHPEFSEALTQAQAAYDRWLYNKIIDNFQNHKCNHNLIKLVAAWQCNASDKVADNPVRLPGYAAAKSFEEKYRILDEALQDRRINTTQHETLMRALLAKSQIDSSVDFEQRLKVLEEKDKK
jgi:hypothetical protein